jgi:regulator of sigma E protease
MFIALAIIISLSLLVISHELGHFIVGRIFKVRVEEFGVGYPPRLGGMTKVNGKYKFFFGKKVPPEEHGTIYSINWIPFGGFNRFLGEEAGSSQDKASLYAKPWWQRLLVVVAGAGMNIVLAIILLSFSSLFGSFQEITPELLQSHLVIKDVNVRVIGVAEKSPAELAGLKINDRVLNVDGQVFTEVPQMQDYLKTKLDQPVQMKIQRGQQELSLIVTPKLAKDIFNDNTLQGAAIGVNIAKVGQVYYPFFRALWNGMVRTFWLLIAIVQAFYDFFSALIVQHKMIAQAAGVVGLAAMTAEAAQAGIIYLSQFVASISLLIAITQLIPFPALDGGRGLFFLIEGIFRKPVNPKIENIINSVGFMLLIILMIYVTYQDIIRVGAKIFHIST